jgi:hypothetical protein
MPEFLSEPVRWVIPAVLVVSVAGVVVSLWWEKRRPSSFTRRRPDALAAWHSLPAGAQEAVDKAVLDAAEAAEAAAKAAVARAVDAQMEAAIQEAAKRNALFHP